MSELIRRSRAVAGFVPDCARLFRRLAQAEATPRAQRVALLGLGLYLLSPIDLVPDFIPVAGQLDDAALVLLALTWVLRTHGDRAIREAWPGPESSLRVVLRAAGASGRPATTL